jgi:hypothetical protein
MRMKMGMAVLAVVVLTGAGSALAQAPEDRIAAAVTRAGQVGIPVQLLESKIAEGKAKGVPMDRIAAAVERRLEALERARDAMAGQQEPPGRAALAVGADAIETGVSETVLATIARTAPEERRAVAIAALTHLVQLGHVPEVALDRVREALQRSPEALLNLAAGAEGRRGPPPGVGRPDGAGEAGPGTVGPPAGVPAPGKPPQAGRPGGPPVTPARPPITPPGAGRGGGPGTP